MEHKTMLLAVAAVIVVIVVIAAAYMALYAGSALQTTTASTLKTSVQNTTSPVTTKATTVPVTKANASGSSANYTVRLADNATLGQYLVNQTGFTLYLNSQGTASACTGQCLYYWHPFYTADLRVQPGLNISKFSTIDVNGTEQLTYYGYPIYTYIADKAPGWVSGSGVAGLWNVVTYPHIST